MDSERLRRQRQAWEHEHHVPRLLRMAGTDPSDAVKKLMEFARSHPEIQLGTTVLDAECGKGRKALYLAQQGFTVMAFDLVEHAIAVLRQRASRQSLQIEARVADMGKPWQYADASFDWLLDDTASMSIGSYVGREIGRDEMRRVLKPGGYLLNVTITHDDPFLRRLPGGKEPGTVITPDGKIEKLFSAEELEAWYAPHFQIISQMYVWKPRSLWPRNTIWSLMKLHEHPLEGENSTK